VCSAARSSSEFFELASSTDRFLVHEKSNSIFSATVWHSSDTFPTIQIPGTRSLKKPEEHRVCPAIAVPPRNVASLEHRPSPVTYVPFCRHGEHEMLSPHEFATLLLVQEAPNQVEMAREELDALLERQLVQLENLASGRQQWRLTASGDSTMKAFKRFS
jgi:hypothetical protein